MLTMNYCEKRRTATITTFTFFNNIFTRIIDALPYVRASARGLRLRSAAPRSGRLAKGLVYYRGTYPEHAHLDQSRRGSVGRQDPSPRVGARWGQGRRPTEHPLSTHTVHTRATAERPRVQGGQGRRASYFARGHCPSSAFLRQIE